MAYSTSPTTIENMSEHLEPLRQMRSYRWSTPKGRAHRLAQRIRECFAIARSNRDRYPELAAAADFFRIEVPNTYTVQAIPKETQTVRGEPLDEQPSAGGVEFGGPQTRVGLSTAMEVIDAWTKHLPSNDTMHFPQTVLPTDELVALHRWARGRTPRLMMFVPEGSLTLSLEDPSVVEHSWHPQMTPTEETFDL